jgi:hypothetical protein
MTLRLTQSCVRRSTQACQAARHAAIFFFEDHRLQVQRHGHAQQPTKGATHKMQMHGDARCQIVQQLQVQLTFKTADPTHGSTAQ